MKEESESNFSLASTFTALVVLVVPGLRVPLTRTSRPTTEAVRRPLSLSMPLELTLPSLLPEIARDLVKILKDAKQVVPPQLEELTMFGGAYLLALARVRHS